MQEAATAYIIRGFHGSNYTITPNHIFSNADLTAAAKATLAYLISKPSTWRLRINDLTKAMGYGRSKAYKCLNELRLAGYAFMKRGQKKVEWFFFDTPQKTPPSRAESQSVTFQRDENEHTYKEIKKTEINKITTTAAIKTEPEPVKKEVVVSEVIEKEPSTPVCAVEKIEPNTPAKAGHETIPGIEPQLQSTAKKILDKITTAQAALVLVTFSSVLKTKQINNKIGYLHALVNAVINGTFTEPDRSQLEAMQTAADRVARSQQRLEEEKKRGKISNDDYFSMLRAQYGEKAEKLARGDLIAKFKDHLTL